MPSLSALGSCSCLLAWPARTGPTSLVSYRNGQEGRQAAQNYPFVCKEGPVATRGEDGISCLITGSAACVPATALDEEPRGPRGPSSGRESC